MFFKVLGLQIINYFLSNFYFIRERCRSGFPKVGDIVPGSDISKGAKKRGGGRFKNFGRQSERKKDLRWIYY